MGEMRFSKELYSKVALIKAAYNFTDIAYVHLDADTSYYYVTLKPKDNRDVSEAEFSNEMLIQSVRHEVYQQTKNIRELILACTMASSVIVEDSAPEEDNLDKTFLEEEILKDWFTQNENKTI